MQKKIQLIIDIASPNAYFVHRTIPTIFPQSDGFEVEYLPCLLGGIFKSTNNQAPWMTFAEVPHRLAYDRLEMMRFIEKHQLTKWKMNPHFPPNSVMPMRGAIVAEQLGLLPEYLETLLVGMWENQLKVDEPEIFHKLLTENNLPVANIVAGIQTQEVKDKLKSNTEYAVSKGAFGVPTWVVGDEIFFGKERMEQVKEYAQSN